MASELDRFKTTSPLDQFKVEPAENDELSRFKVSDLDSYAATDLDQLKVPDQTPRYTGEEGEVIGMVDDAGLVGPSTQPSPNRLTAYEELPDTRERDWLSFEGYPKEFYDLTQPSIHTIKPATYIDDSGNIQMVESDQPFDRHEYHAALLRPHDIEETFHKNAMALPHDDPRKITYEVIEKFKNDMAEYMTEDMTDSTGRKYMFGTELGRAFAGQSLRIMTSGLDLTSDITRDSKMAFGDSQFLDSIAEIQSGVADKLYDLSFHPQLAPAEDVPAWAVPGNFVAQSVGSALAYMSGAMIAGKAAAHYGSGWLMANGVNPMLAKVAGESFRKIGTGAYGGTVGGRQAYRRAKELGATEAQAQLNQLIAGTTYAVVESLQVGHIIKATKHGQGSVKEIARAAHRKAWDEVSKHGADLGYQMLYASVYNAVEEAIEEGTDAVLEARLPDGSWVDVPIRAGMGALGGAVVGNVFTLGGSLRFQGDAFHGQRLTTPERQAIYDAGKTMGRSRQVKAEIAEAGAILADPESTASDIAKAEQVMREGAGKLQEIGDAAKLLAKSKRITPAAAIEAIEFIKNLPDMQGKRSKALDKLQEVVTKMQEMGIPEIELAKLTPGIKPGFTYKGTDNPEDVASILTQGLRKGSHVSTNLGQGTEGYGITLEFDNSSVAASGVSHRPGDGITTNAGAKPARIYVDTSAYLTVPGYETATRKLLDYARKLGIKVTQEQYDKFDIPREVWLSGDRQLRRLVKDWSDSVERLDAGIEGDRNQGQDTLQEVLRVVDNSIPVYTSTYNEGTESYGKYLPANDAANAEIKTQAEERGGLAKLVEQRGYAEDYQVESILGNIHDHNVSAEFGHKKKEFVKQIATEINKLPPESRTEIARIRNRLAKGELSVSDAETALQKLRDLSKIPAPQAETISINPRTLIDYKSPVTANQLDIQPAEFATQEAYITHLQRLYEAGETIDPIVVRKVSDNRYDIVEGEHRAIAAARAGVQIDATVEGKADAPQAAKPLTKEKLTDKEKATNRLKRAQKRYGDVIDKLANIEKQAEESELMLRQLGIPTDQLSMPIIELMVRNAAENGTKVLPDNPSLRSDVLKDLMLMQKKIDNSNRKIAKAKKDGKVLNLYNIWKPLRYAIIDLEEKTGAHLYVPMRNMLRKQADRTNGIRKIIRDSIYLKNLKHITAKDNELMASWLYESNQGKKDAIADQMSTEAFGIVTELHQLLQGQIGKEVQENVFRLWDKTDKAPPDIKHYLQEGQTADDILAEGRQAKKDGKLREWIANQPNWGLRAEYYLSDRGVPDLHLEVLESVGKDALRAGPESARTPDTIVSAARSRKGKPAIKKGSVVNNIIYHAERAAALNAIADDLEVFYGELNKTDVSYRDIQHIGDHVDNIMLRHMPPRGWEVPATIAKRWFWRARMSAAVKPASLLWRLMRNSIQDLTVGGYVISHKTYLKEMKNLTKQIAKGESLETTHPDLALYLTEHFKNIVSQQQSYYRDFLLHDYADLSSNYGNKTARQIIAFMDATGSLYGMTDEMNRYGTFIPQYLVTKHAAMEYLDGSISKNEFYNRTRLDSITKTQRLLVNQLLDSGDIGKLSEMSAEWATENVNARYSTAERSAVEQSHGGRLVMGLYVFPRMYHDAIKENGVIPFFDGMRTGKMNMARRGFENILSGTVLSYLIGVYGLGAITGRGAYEPIETVMYQPLDPGMSMILDAVGNVTQNAHAYARGDKPLVEAADETADYLWRVAERNFIPLADELLAAYENANDVQGVTFYRLVRKRLVERAGGDAEFKEAVRSGKEKLMHQLFLTYEQPEAYYAED